jgi:hypothetical protein
VFLGFGHQLRRIEMIKDSAARQPNVVGARLLTPTVEEHSAERRPLEEALEDDEVREALKSFHSERSHTTTSGQRRG